MSTSTPATELKVRRRIGASSLNAIVAGLKSGHLAIFPTETVYGLGASAFSPLAIKRIYALKGRQNRKPLAVLVHDLKAAVPLLESIPPEAHRLAKQFWPGPLTIVFKASPLGRLVMGGLDTIGVRIPDHPVALQLLKAINLPLATTSVNRSGDRPVVTGVEASRLFSQEVDWVIDGGACRVKEASSVVDMSHYPFTVVRQGAIAKKTLEAVLGA
jgi:L-threonylcarbamoyladenylate synthase